MAMTVTVVAPTIAGACLGTWFGLKESEKGDCCDKVAAGALCGLLGGGVGLGAGVAISNLASITLNAAKVITTCFSKDTECASETIVENACALIPAAAIATAVAARIFSSCSNRATRA